MNQHTIQYASTIHSIQSCLFCRYPKYQEDTNNMYPPFTEVYHWHAIQACTALCVIFTFVGIFILCCGARAPRLEEGMSL